MTSGKSITFEELKRNVVSTLLPFKDGATEYQLCQSYRSLIGCQIPYEQVGYGSLLELLRDLPLRKDEGKWKAIPDESTNHLARMISAQRTKKRKGKKEPSPFFPRGPPQKGKQVRASLWHGYLIKIESR